MLEPLDVAAEEHGPAAADAHRLEGSGAADDRLVVGGEDRRRRIDETAAGDGDRQQAQRRLPSVSR
jgi:hypothetical protein